MIELPSTVVLVSSVSVVLLWDQTSWVDLEDGSVVARGRDAFRLSTRYSLKFLPKIKAREGR